MATTPNKSGSGTVDPHVPTNKRKKPQIGYYLARVLGILGRMNLQWGTPPSVPTNGPVNIGLPSWADTIPEVGDSITANSCNTGSWTGDPVINYTKQYKKNGVNITVPYTVVSGDVGLSFTCAVTADNGIGSPVTATSAPTSTVTEIGGPAPGYYISPTGNDTTGNGSYANPWKSIKKLHDNLSVGGVHQGWVRGGTYNQTITEQLTNDGASGTLLKIFALPGDGTPIFNGSAIPAGNYSASCNLRLFNCSYTHIKGLDFRHAPDFGVKIQGASNDNLIELNKIHDVGQNAGGSAIGSLGEGKGLIIFDSGARNQIRNNDVYRCISSIVGNADGMQIASIGHDNVVEGNRVYLCTDDGIDLYNIADGTIQGRVIVRKNWVYRNGYLFDGVTPAGDGSGIKTGGTRNTSTENGAHEISDNLIFRNKRYGINFNGARVGVQKWYHNTMWANINQGVTTGYDVYIDSAGQANDIKNNVQVPFGSADRYITGSSILTTNSWQIASVGDSDFESLDYTLAENAVREADGSLPSIAFLRPVTGSDLIDVGTIISGRSYTGSAPNLGYTEAVGTAPSNPEMFTSPTMSSAAEYVSTSGATYSIVSDELEVVATAISGDRAARRNFSGLDIGATYEFSVEARTTLGSAPARARIYETFTGSFGQNGTAQTTSLTDVVLTYQFVATHTTIGVFLGCIATTLTGAPKAYFDNISLKKL